MIIKKRDRNSDERKKSNVDNLIETLKNSRPVMFDDEFR